ncbi:GntR family transcriptional regulator [Coriobacteriales bacterium OH1046]|nr:GntR family transcriptional regulator [Coriobacteriales bacterium OH1046]
MEIVIRNSSDKPIYEQIASQIRDDILTGKITPGEALPSIRSLAASLRISAITTKRAYSDLEAQGYIETVPGKGCFVSANNLELLREDRLRHVEASLARVIADARIAGLSMQELHEMLDFQLEEEE